MVTWKRLLDGCGPRRVLLWLALVGLSLAAVAVPVGAHAGLAGESTEFVMPAWVVWFAGVLVVALSFALIGAFLSREEQQERVYQRARGEHETGSETDHRAWTRPRLLMFALFVVVGVNVFLPTDSDLPAAFLWLFLWVVLPLIAYTTGNPWPRLSPFVPLLRVARWLRGGRAPERYPGRLGLWPAVVLFLGAVALEVGDVGWTGQARPLAMLVVAYFVVTFVGMLLYGSKWLENGEVIGRMLTWWATVSPMTWQDGRPRWRGLTAGLQRLETQRVGAVAFTVAILYGVNHDVFLHTQLGAAALVFLEGQGVPFPSLGLLLVGFLLFLTAWMLAARAMRDQAESLSTARATAAVFVASLLPIAAAYHLVHNVPYLWENLPLLVAGVTDPFGLGYATALLHLPAQFSLSAQMLVIVAAAQVVLIVLGHLLAVLTAHKLAFRHHPSRVQAVRAELPLTLMMVVYTGVGLALLSTQGGVVA